MPSSSIFNNGLPLCLAAGSSSYRRSLSKQIADHDRRREEFKRSQTELREIEAAVLRSLDLVIFNHAAASTATAA